MSSVVIKSINRQLIADTVAGFVAQVRREHPEVKRVIWFGSWVNGRPTPGSDVDLCLVLTASNKPLKERIPDYLPLGFPVGIDLFAYTEAELEQLPFNAPTWYAAIMAGQEL